MFEKGDVVKHKDTDHNIVMEVLSIDNPNTFTGKFITFEELPDKEGNTESGWYMHAFTRIGRMSRPDPVILERWFYQALNQLESCLKKVIL